MMELRKVIEARTGRGSAVCNIESPTLVVCDQRGVLRWPTVRPIQVPFALSNFGTTITSAASNIGHPNFLARTFEMGRDTEAARRVELRRRGLLRATSPSEKPMDKPSDRYPERLANPSGPSDSGAVRPAPAP